MTIIDQRSDLIPRHHQQQQQHQLPRHRHHLYPRAPIYLLVRAPLPTPTKSEYWFHLCFDSIFTF